MTKAATILSYDRSLNREGVAIDEGAGWFRLITPRPTFAAISRIWYVIIAFLLFQLLVVMMSALQEPPGQRWVMIMPVSEFVFLLLATLLFIFFRSNQRFIFEVTRSNFVMTRIDIGSSRRRWIFRRDAITAINASGSPGKISIHARGQDLIELFISRDQAVVQRVVEALIAALRDDMGGIDRTLPDLLEEPLNQNATARHMLITASVVMAAAGIGMIFVLPVPVFGIYMLMFSCVPLGILYGTQKKDFYV